MKALPKKLLPLTLFAIAVTSLFSVRPAQAYTVRLKEVGANVVANGSGAINLTGLTLDVSGILTPGTMGANFGLIQTGQLTDVLVDTYTGITGPTSFGPGGPFFFMANTGSGDFVGIAGLAGDIEVPGGYTSGDPLTNSLTFDNATFASLGVTPGVYTWRWGTNGANQFFRLVIGPNTVPDGGSTVSLLGFALFGLAALRRKLGC
jgi:hypothetical protein